MPEIETEFALFKSIVSGIESNLFPTRKTANSDNLEIAHRYLNNPDVERFLQPEFLEELRAKLNFKAQGIVKQAELEQEQLVKFANFDREVDPKVEEPKDIIGTQEDEETTD